MSPPPEPPTSRITLSHGPSQRYTTEGRNVRVASAEELRLPPGAIRLSRREIIAAANRYKFRNDGPCKAWRRFEELWHVFSGVPCAITSIYLISIVRHKFKLGRYHARGIQYITASAFPTLFVPICAVPLVAEPAMIKEIECANCMGVRTGLLQVAGGVLWAGSIAVVGALYYAKRYHTVPLPPISPRYAKDFGKILSQPFIPAMPVIFAHSVFQFVVGYVGGIKYWYYGQELNFTEAYIGQESRAIYGVDLPYPEFTRTRVEVDWLTEMIAKGNYSYLFGRAVADDTDNEEEEDELPLRKIARYLTNPRLIYDYLTGSY